MRYLPTKLMNKLSSVSRGLDESHPEYNKKPRRKLGKLLQKVVKNAWALEDKCRAQDDLISENHSLIQAAYSELVALSDSRAFRWNPALKNACQYLHKAAINDETHWGVTAKDEVQHGIAMPDPDL